MKQDHIFNFVWWLTTPFFMVFFFLILLLFTGGFYYINSFLFLTLYLVTIPLFIDWFIAMFYPKNETLRPQISAGVYLLDFVLTYFFIVNNLSDEIKIFYILFAIQIMISFIIKLFKENQYSFLLGSFFSITLIFSILMISDLFWIILVELLFAGLFMKYFLKYELDKLGKMVLYYFVGFLTTSVSSFILSKFFSL